MKPSEVALYLRHMATAIDVANNPSKSRVASDLVRLILATDRTFSLKIQKAMLNELSRDLPKDFSAGITYDTNPGGKGWAAGRVSFGVPVESWLQHGLIGGMHFEMKYVGFKSEQPEQPEEDPNQPEWLGRFDENDMPIQQDMIEFDVSGGFYSHKSGHAIDPTGKYYQHFGKALVEIDRFEEVTDVALDKVFTSNVKKVVDAVLADPPEGAIGAAGRKQRDRSSPTYSVNNLVNFKKERGSMDITHRELNEVIDNYMERNPEAGSRYMIEKKIRNQLRGFNLPY